MSQSLGDSVQIVIYNYKKIKIKFHKNQIGRSIITEVQEKIRNLSKPKNFSLRPLLIHACEISSEVDNADYFVKIIDLTAEL